MQERPLRDALAIERTLLANERTGLAWLRTAITLFLAGVTLFHFTDAWLSWVGLSLVPLGMFAGVYGRVRYGRTRSRILEDAAQS